MLTHIAISHFTIVHELNLDFQSGLHVLTGETGAGKSIWIDAVDIGLGERTDDQIIYPGENTCDISLCFDLRDQASAKKWLSAHDFPADDECVVRRVISRDKGSRTTINGIPAPQQWTRELADLILCIHGQHQHQQLLKAEQQRKYIDRYAKNDDLIEQIQTYYEQWKTLDREHQALQSQMKSKTSDLTLWQYQLEELQQLNLLENEYENCFARYQALHRRKEFSATLNEVYGFLYQDDAPCANTLAEQALQQLERVQNDSNIDNIKSLLQTATIHLEEAREALEQYCTKTESSADELDSCEKRLALLQDMARKHHTDPSQLSAIETTLIQKIKRIEKADELLATIEKQKTVLVQNYQKIAKKLTENRSKAANALSLAITQQMQLLGMTGGKLEIRLEKLEAGMHPLGAEQIQFFIATNPGQTPYPLSKIVSGGELSRLSLILQVLTAEKKNTPTFIFDEVDVGIGGKTADLVGSLLRELSAQAQVLCVTHLPQVAAKAHHHFKAEKTHEKNKTSTTIRVLNEKERMEELARMLSGSKITDKSMQHAKELLMQ